MAEKLTAKQQRFVDEYLIDSNGKQACIRAGYSPNGAEVQASRLLTNVNVKAAVTEGQKRLAEQAELTAQEVIDGLRREATLSGKGSNHSARVSAWSWLGKHLALFTDKVEHGGEIPVLIIEREAE